MVHKSLLQMLPLRIEFAHSGAPFVFRQQFGNLRRTRMSDHEHSNQPTTHHHDCGNLFGCGDEKGTGILRSDIQEAASTKRAMDRLLHMDEMDQEQLDRYLSLRGRSRRQLLRASSFMGVLAAVGPWFANLTFSKLALAEQ